MAEYPIYQVDAFTSQTFGGNPAAVVPLDAWLPDEVMQNIAIENNLSETAFFVPTDKGFHLRWFTPTTEVNLCGHATLATSWVIFNELGYDQKEIRFDSLSGELIVQKSEDGLTLNFPTWESQFCEIEEPIIKEIFGRAASEIYKGKKWVLIFDDEDFIRTAKPNLTLLKTIDCEGVVISALSKNPNIDFVSRYFGPQVGIDEDPVTGSAHCVLTPIWAKKLNQTEFQARQVSPRGGDLDLRLQGDRLMITGQATPYMKGAIYV